MIFFVLGRWLFRCSNVPGSAAHQAFGETIRFIDQRHYIPTAVHAVFEYHSCRPRV